MWIIFQSVASVYFHFISIVYHSQVLKNKTSHLYKCPCAQVCLCVTGVLMDYEGARVGRTPGLTSKSTAEHPGVVTLGRPGTSCCVGPVCVCGGGGSGGQSIWPTTWFRCQREIYCGSLMPQQIWQVLDEHREHFTFSINQVYKIWLSPLSWGSASAQLTHNTNPVCLVVFRSVGKTQFFLWTNRMNLIVFFSLFGVLSSGIFSNRVFMTENHSLVSKKAQWKD